MNDGHLTPTESAIVAVLEANPDRVVPYEEIVAAMGYAVAYRSMDMVKPHAWRLRWKGWPVVTVRGVGLTLREDQAVGARLPAQQTDVCGECGETFPLPLTMGRVRYCPRHRGRLAAYRRYRRNKAARRAA